MSQFGVLRHILDHPLNRSRRPGAIRDYLAWQFRSRLVPGPVAVPFVNDAALIVRRGMHGATQNVYCGLADFEDMSFLLHFLRAGDLFVDVGANVGSYTVLASAAIGARSVAFEPNPETYPDLMANIHSNGIAERVQARMAGAGAKSGILRFEANGPQTRVFAPGIAVKGAASGAVFESPVVTLDEALANAAPALIKIDVEGFEGDVLAGAGDLLRQSALLALIVENNPESVRFGFEPDQAHTILLANGFAAATYSPRERKLTLLGDRYAKTQNSIYIRGFAEVQSRLRSAPPFRVKGQTI